MDHSELLSLLPSLLSLLVVVAVLIGLFFGIVKLFANYGLVIIALIGAGLFFIDGNINMDLLEELKNLVIAQLDRATAF
jgi:hypothetical protein